MRRYREGWEQGKMGRTANFFGSPKTVTVFPAGRAGGGGDGDDGAQSQWLQCLLCTLPSCPPIYLLNSSHTGPFKTKF